MTSAAPTTMAARRKSNRNRQFAGTLVHYLGFEAALEACHKKEWNDVRDEILRQHPASAETEAADS